MFFASRFKQSTLKIILSLLFLISITQIFAVDKTGISLAQVNESSGTMKMEEHESPDIFKNERKRMVDEQIVRRGVDNAQILQVLLKVRRDLFVPSEQKEHAYEDRPLPIGYGQTISQPYIVAYMTQKIDLKSDHKVLEIGTGSGYQAAILAELAKEVYTVEIIPELGKSAIKRFKNLKYDNVNVKINDGYYGWEEKAPFDRIIVTAAAGHVPPPLLKQLKDGGTMIIPVGSFLFSQYLILIKKSGSKIITEKLIPVRFVPLTGYPGND